MILGLLRRIFGGDESRSERVVVAQEARDAVDPGSDELVELEVVGESHRQAALARIAGPKDEWGKREQVGVTLRAEPRNEYDPNAIRVEVMGQHLGYIGREHAKVVSQQLQAKGGGVIEASGVIVGGWSRQARGGDGRYTDGADEGHYGIRVWLTRTDLKRLGVRPRAIDPEYRPRHPAPPPIAADERRLSPSRSDYGQQDYGSQVTVTCEEHYQDAIEASVPSDWEPDCSWPVLVELVVAASNPHSKRAEKCIEVRIGARAVGYFTPKMTERHLSAVEDSIAGGKRATANATVTRGTKGGDQIWRLKVLMPGAES